MPDVLGGGPDVEDAVGALARHVERFRTEGVAADPERDSFARAVAETGALDDELLAFEVDLMAVKETANDGEGFTKRDDG